MIHRGFFILLSALMPALAQATETTDSKAISLEVKEYLNELYSSQFPNLNLRDDVRFHPSNLDKRLALSACDQPLHKTVSSPQILGSNITVKVMCEGQSPWTIYVPVKVEIYADILVASRNLARGTIVEDSDVTFARMNITQAGMGYFEDPLPVLGMELKRGIRAGNTIQSAALKQPTVVKRGETVQLQARIAGVAVVTNAQALSHGQVGQQIRVKNLASQRVVDAVVIGPGKVSIHL